MANEIDGLPDVDLHSVVDDLAKQEKDTPTGEMNRPKSDEVLDLGQFKNPKDLLKSYKEVQGAFTNVTQSIKEKEAEIQRLQEELELSRGAQHPYQDPVVNQNYNSYEDPELTVARQVNQTLIANVLRKEESKNRNEFHERYAYVQMLAKQYPHLAQTPDGVETLFEKSDRVREERMKVASQRALESVFGQPLNEGQLKKLKETIGITESTKTETQQTNALDAYMPDTSSASRNRTGLDNQKDYDSKITEAAEKGDIDATLQNVFDKALQL